MSRSSPFVKIDIGVDGISVTLSQDKDENDPLSSIVDIVMDSVQFSNTVYTLKAIERQLILDSQQENQSKEDRPKSPTPPDNFEELFANMDGFNNGNNTQWMLEPTIASNEEIVVSSSINQNINCGAEKMEVSFGEEKERQFSHQQESIAAAAALPTEEEEEYDPVNFSIAQYVPTMGAADATTATCAADKHFDEKIYQLYHPSSTEITVKTESVDLHESREVEATTVAVISSIVADPRASPYTPAVCVEGEIKNETSAKTAKKAEKRVR